MNYLLVGEESYNLRNRRNELVNKIVGDENQMAVSIYRDNKDLRVQDIVDDCLMVPFLSEQKAVVYENPDFSDKDWKDRLAPLVNYLKQPNETTSLIIVIEKSVSQKSEIVKLFAKYMKYESYDLLSQQDFETYVRKQLNENNLNLSNKAMAVLLDRLPNSIENFQRELEKLKIYPGEIDEEVVRSLVVRPLEQNVMNLSNAVTSRNMSKALEIYHDLLTFNRSNSVAGLIGLLAANFRAMAQAVSLKETGMSNKEIAERLGYSEGRVYMVLKDCGRRSSSEIYSILNRLAQLDQDIKSGKINDKDGLELFIVRTIQG